MKMTALMKDRPLSPPKSTKSTNVNSRRFTLIRRKLDEIATWTPEALHTEFSSWTPDEILQLWDILEQPFRGMCSAFGLASHRMQVGPRGIRTDGQIKRLAVLQEYARLAREKLPQEVTDA